MSADACTLVQRVTERGVEEGFRRPGAAQDGLVRDAGLTGDGLRRQPAQAFAGDHGDRRENEVEGHLIAVGRRPPSSVGERHSSTFPWVSSHLMPGSRVRLMPLYSAMSTGRSSSTRYSRSPHSGTDATSRNGSRYVRIRNMTAPE